MRPVPALLAPLVMAMTLSGCQESLLSTESIDSPAFAKASSSSADVLSFADGTIIPGASSAITRNDNGVSMTLHTGQLIPGNAYTMWVVIFNVPGECSDECGEDDLFIEDVGVDVLYVGGNVVGGSGKATFAGRRNVGDNSNSLFDMLGVASPGLVDPHGSELHLIVRDHGEAIPGQIPAQIHTFEGACTADSSFGLGDGPNVCADVQFSVHMP